MRLIVLVPPVFVVASATANAEDTSCIRCIRTTDNTRNSRKCVTRVCVYMLACTRLHTPQCCWASSYHRCVMFVVC
jgi:hypothetical protein